MLYRTIRYTGKWFNEGGVGQEGALKLRVLMTDWSHIYHIFHFASFYFCIFGFSLLLVILRHTVFRIFPHNLDLETRGKIIDPKANLDMTLTLIWSYPTPYFEMTEDYWPWPLLLNISIPE